jgi:hypothetical protein
MIESEKKLEIYLNKRIKQLGGWSFKLLPFLVAGLPDRLCVVPHNQIFFAEVKTTGKKPLPIQKVIIKKLRSFGCEVYVVDSSEEIDKMLHNYA